MLKAKRGMIYENIIFIMLNLAFFIILLTFIFLHGNGRPVYEQVYAKQVAFMIDEAKPGTTILIDMGEILEKYEKEKVDNLIKIDKQENKVLTSFGEGGKRSFRYFSENNVDLEYRGRFLKIIVENDEK